MARNRQRAKQRQAERRARRLAEERDGDAKLVDDPTAVDPSPAVPADLAVGAPPADEGRSDTVIEDEPALNDDEGRSERLVEHDPVLGDRPTFAEPPETEDEALQEIEDWEVGGEEHLTEDEVDAELEAEEDLAGRGEDGFEVRGRRGRDDADKHKHRPRVIQFLIAVWAELQRVQWPNRQAMITLTCVVLGFVLIAGGYLGLLDAVFSELIKAIL
jgi:preprotein translocase subunit SecE